MNAALWVAIGLAVLSAFVSVATIVINYNAQTRAMTLEKELERQATAEATLERYREPLADAANDLHRRLGNILDRNFLAYLGQSEERDEEAIESRDEEAIDSTLFRFAQYFGWTEILRRDIQFLRFAEAEQTRKVWDLQWDVTQAFSSDSKYSDGQAFMLWAEEQRGIGERMIAIDGGKSQCIGYATFVETRHKAFPARWFQRIEDDFRSFDPEDGSERLRDVEHHLVKLVELLDPEGLRKEHATSI
jgi:hypothetical protein